MRVSWYQKINADASVFWTMRQISFNVDPGVKYRIGGPTISARASVCEWKIFKKKRKQKQSQSKLCKFQEQTIIFFFFSKWRTKNLILKITKKKMKRENCPSQCKYNDQMRLLFNQSDLHGKNWLAYNKFKRKKRAHLNENETDRKTENVCINKRR